MPGCDWPQWHQVAVLQMLILAQPPSQNAHSQNPQPIKWMTELFSPHRLIWSEYSRSPSFPLSRTVVINTSVYNQKEKCRQVQYCLISQKTIRNIVMLAWQSHTCFFQILPALLSVFFMVQLLKLIKIREYGAKLERGGETWVFRWIWQKKTDQCQ